MFPASGAAFAEQIPRLWLEITRPSRSSRFAARVLETTYEFPYLAHAALEPLNAIARIEGGRVEVWGGHQMPDLYGFISAKIAGVTPDKVTLHVMKTGGGFGRRAVADGDVVSEAVAVSKALGRGKRANEKFSWSYHHGCPQPVKDC